MLKIGLVIASAGGPARMSVLFESGFKEDAAWLIIQRHADAVCLDRFAEALSEMTHRRVKVAREPQALHGGDILVLLSDRDYAFGGNRIQPIEGKGDLHLDRFLLALSDSKAAVACLLLTGPSLEGQGMVGLKSLAGSGGRLYAMEGLPEPAQSAVSEFMGSGPACESMPLAGALSQVTFGRPVAEAQPG